ncbi:diguanylate cyclase [Pseudomonas oryzihabitans]|nr:diguanylate cyclase [Pseudomonas psychrotolerans]KTT03090.1 diguanylate cyclase [Pseudomonas psychrotolerans]KTT22475.1 diguanylate cyclase [Pseudomonas psychrotolerans]KTT39433.1 diguanylate cyclase [Pseudomonas psychrotolerans]KTT46430.1 diguanylate cyclase [Pseudomonas psychrotolerans]
MVYQTHIRQMLQLPNVLAQCTGILGWLSSVLINPFLTEGVEEAGWLAFSCMVVSCLAMTTARRFTVWRLFALVFVLFEALAFRFQILGMGAAGHDWMIPLAVVITLGSTILFSHVLDYGIAAGAVWLILFHGQLETIGTATLPLLVVMMVCGMVLGLLLNATFVRIVASTLELKEDYRLQAETDSLTGISNRRALMLDLEQVCRDGSSSWHFVMLDIDDFKRINDRFGHDVGDQVLKEAAGTLARHFPEGRFGRLGGEEFGVLLKTDDEQELIQRLQALLDDIRGNTQAGTCFSFSAGVAHFIPGYQPADLLKQADGELYQAKRAGKDRVHYRGGMICG